MCITTIEQILGQSLQSDGTLLGYGPDRTDLVIASG
jgi:hypothetical protein